MRMPLLSTRREVLTPREQTPPRSAAETVKRRARYLTEVESL
jgi:hypothetical protein